MKSFTLPPLKDADGQPTWAFIGMLFFTGPVCGGAGAVLLYQMIKPYLRPFFHWLAN